MSTVLRSQIQCNKCHQIIASLRRHDFRSCKCGSVSLDGGRDYMRVLSLDKGGYTSRSIVIDDDVTKDDARRMIEVLNSVRAGGGASPDDQHPYFDDPPYVPASWVRHDLRQAQHHRVWPGLTTSEPAGYNVEKILQRLEGYGLLECRRSKTGKRTGWRCTKPMVAFGWYQGKFERRPG